MITVNTSFLGLDITALCHRDNAGRWAIDDYSVKHEGQDAHEYINSAALRKVEEAIIEECLYQTHKFI